MINKTSLLATKIIGVKNLTRVVYTIQSISKFLRAYMNVRTCFLPLPNLKGTLQIANNYINAKIHLIAIRALIVYNYLIIIFDINV